MTWAKQAAFTDTIELGKAVRAFDVPPPTTRCGDRVRELIGRCSAIPVRCSPDWPAARRSALRVKLDMIFIISNYDLMVAVSDIPMQVDDK